MDYFKKLKEQELDPKGDILEQFKELATKFDYLEQLIELADAVHEVEKIVKRINEKKQAIDYVSVTTSPDTILYPEHRTDTECEIVCFAHIGGQAFDLRDLIDTTVSGDLPIACVNINGVEVTQWAIDEARKKKND